MNALNQMPPLCTAGYGLSIGSYSFFLGAMYLFFINAFFISLSAYFVFKILRVPPVVYPDQEHKKYQKVILMVLGFIVTQDLPLASVEKIQRWIESQSEWPVTLVVQKHSDQ